MHYLHTLFINFMTSILLTCLIYTTILIILNSLFSLNNKTERNITDNYECGFYPLVSSSFNYKSNFLAVVLHFVLFEQELIIVLIYIFGLATTSSTIIILVFLILLYLDLLL